MWRGQSRLLVTLLYDIHSYYSKALLSCKVAVEEIGLQLAKCVNVGSVKVWQSFMLYQYCMLYD